MSVVIIINPASGVRGSRDRGQGRAALAARTLDALGISGRVEVTAGPGHAFALASDAAHAGVPLVLAWGGDGTVNEVGSALAFRETTLGIVPAGSGNGLARMLGLDKIPERAIAAAIRGRDRRIDAGELGGRLFFNVAGIGFDAEVARVFNASPRRGPVPYGTAILRELFRYRPGWYQLEVGREQIQGAALFIALANGQQYGTGAIIAPRARLDDGLIDLIAVEPRSPVAALWQIRRLFDGTMDRVPGVILRPVTEVSIRSDRPMRMHLDGEVVEVGTAVTARAIPGALRLRVPAGA